MLFDHRGEPVPERGMGFIPSRPTRPPRRMTGEPADCIGFQTEIPEDEFQDDDEETEE